MKFAGIILIIGILFFGFLFAKEHGYLEGVSLGRETVVENNNVVVPVEHSAQSPSEISIDLPQDFTMKSGRELPSAFSLYERELISVEKKDPEEGWVEEMFRISQYFSKSDFDQSLAILLDPKTYPGLRVVSAPVEYSTIDGEESHHYVISLYDTNTPTYGNEAITNDHFVTVPSKFTIISFENIPDFTGNVFTLSETQDIISLIKFGKPLTSEKKSPEEIAVINEAAPTKTQEFFGISLGLPEGVTVRSIANTDSSLSAGTLKVDTIFVLTSEAAGFAIEKSLSQADFDKTLMMVKNMAKESEESGWLVSPPKNYEIDGQQAAEYLQSFNGIDMYAIVVPSKRVSISFVLQALTPYTIDGVHNIISSIKFNY